MIEELFDSSLTNKIIDFFPSSPLVYIIYMISLTIIGLFIIIYLHNKHKKNNKEKEKDKTDKKEIKFEDLMKIAYDIHSSPEDLIIALKVFNRNFNIDDYKEDSFRFFRAILNHRNRDKKLFSFYNDNIVNKYRKYKIQLKNLEMEALNKRERLNSIS